MKLIKALLFSLALLPMSPSFALADYFPMVKGSYWVYDIYTDGELAMTDSVSYTQTIEIEDTLFHVFISYCFEADTLSAIDTGYIYTNFDDPNTIMASNRNQDLVDSAIYGMHSYTEGVSWVYDKGDFKDTMTVEAYGECAVTAGTFQDCYVHSGFVYAPNVGRVKTLMWNDESFYELVDYYIPVVEAATDFPSYNLYPSISEITTEDSIYLICNLTISSTCICPCIDSSEVGILGNKIIVGTMRPYVGFSNYMCDMCCECSDTINLGKLSQGSYELEIVNAFIGTTGMATNQDTLYFDVEASSSLMNNNASNIKLYPIPVTDLLSIDGIKNATVKVMSMDNKLVLTPTLNSSHQINLSSLENGLYLLLIEENGTISSSTIIKQ